VAVECEQLGGEALSVPTDVTDENQVNHLAARAIRRFGRIDAWVNNAGVLALGLVDETPTSTFRQVIETTLFGPIYGARAVLPHFRERQSGVLINVASELGKFGQPYASAYVASKFGLVGFSECLREELMDLPDVHVCTVLPSAIDTPIFQHAANYTGREIKAPEPIYDPEDVARAICSCVEQPQREVVVGQAARRMILMHTLAPGWLERQIASQGPQGILQDRFSGDSEGNLYEPMSEMQQVRGGWKEDSQSGWTRYAVAGAMALGLGLALWWATSTERNESWS
jgi:NAD(P)-dependent dehydrogenase (short-subunit alcohol dehydrogenase family)